MTEIKSFVLYHDQGEIFKKLSKEQAGELIQAIFDYETTGVMPELSELLSYVIIPIKQALDRNRQKYEHIKRKRSEAGSKGGKQTQANQANASFDKQTQANQAINNNNNNNINNNTNTKEVEDTKVSSMPGNSPTTRSYDDDSFLEEVISKTDKVALRTGAKKVLEFFNQHTNKDYRFIDTNLDMIQARLASGVTIRECWQVIIHKTREWTENSEMRQYIRPATLFNKTKFEAYYGELRTFRQQIGNTT